MHKVCEISVAITLYIVISNAIVYASNEKAIHRECNHRSKFTCKELEAARVYLQNRYLNGASIKPQSPPCKSLKVIRDFRCLTDRERNALTKALVQVFKNTDFIDKISYFHTYYWGFVNLLAPTIAWHNQVKIAIQKEIEKFNPSVIIPYWDTSSDGAAPDKALVWEYFGHAGNESNDYCVPDGPFNNLKLKYPNNTCLKREWNTDGTINRWETPEVNTYMLQTGVGSLNNFGTLAFSQHFKKHLYIGGLHGDMSHTQASNEPLFYLFHLFEDMLHIFKWQLESDSTLVDLSWNYFGRHNPLYEYEGTIETADIETDTLLGFNTTTVAEGLTHGFGDFCYIPDRIIEAILCILSNSRPQYPPTVQRLRDALPPQVFAEFFPKFADDTATEFNYHLPNVGNTNPNCKPIPIPIRLNDTVNGRIQLTQFNQIGVNIQQTVLDGEDKIVNFIETLNRYGYCSPYVD